MSGKLFDVTLMEAWACGIPYDLVEPREYYEKHQVLNNFCEWPGLRREYPTDAQQAIAKVRDVMHDHAGLIAHVQRLQAELTAARQAFTETLEALQNERELYAKKFSELQAVANRLMELAHKQQRV